VRGRKSSKRKPSPGLSRSYLAALRAEKAAKRKAIADMAARYVAKRYRAIDRMYSDRKHRSQFAAKIFKPGKRMRGKIIFVGLDGKAIKGRSNRKGYAVYVNRNGKKQLIRKYNRRTRLLEGYPEARQLKSLDVTRARSKRARRQFMTQFLIPAARGEMERKGRKGLSTRRVRYAGGIKTDKFYLKSDSVTQIGKELAKACNGVKSRKDFLVSIGFWLRDNEGKTHFVEINRRFARRDDQRTNPAECGAFLGMEVYGFLAKELTSRGLVLSGSAGHIRRLKQNRGEARDEWTKGGFLWEGHDSLDATIVKIEYRIDQQSFGK